MRRTCLAMNSYWDLALMDDEPQALAQDTRLRVPFCLGRRPSRFGGRERLEPLSALRHAKLRVPTSPCPTGRC